MEARSCGTPVITYKTGGSAESAGNSGIVIDQGDISEVINKIHEIKENGKPKKEIPISCSVEQCVSSYVDEIRGGTSLLSKSTTCSASM